MLLNNAENNGQAHPCPFFRRFRREERIKNPITQSRRDPRTKILNRQHQVDPRNETNKSIPLTLIEVCHPTTSDHFPTPPPVTLVSIGHQIEKHLLQLCFVSHDNRKF